MDGSNPNSETSCRIMDHIAEIQQAILSVACAAMVVWWETGDHG